MEELVPLEMNLFGLTDLIAPITDPSNECAHGHNAPHVSNGLCLGCLLQAGLSEDEGSGNESLDTLFSEIE